MRRETRSVWAGIGIAAVIVVAMTSVALVVIGAALVGFGDGMSHLGERKHLAPIPIAQNACPYVSLMHTAADYYQINAGLFGVGFDARGRMLPWTTQRARLNATLEVFEASIKQSAPHFPARIRAQLAVTMRAAEEGRAQVARAHDAIDLMNRAESTLQAGQQAFGFASDLVGKQCGVPLGADSSAMPFPLNTTTTTVAPRRPPRVDSSRAVQDGARTMLASSSSASSDEPSVYASESRRL